MEDKKMVINWSGKSFDYTEKELAVLVESARTADPMTQGRYLEQFEEDFSAYLGIKNCFAVANATSALDIAAILSGLKQGDEVIIPAHTFCASAYPFGRTGANIVWADIESDTRLISRASIEKLITDKTKVIVVVHLYGLMADMDAIIEIAKKHDLFVIEDCAQSIGAELNGKKSGTFGDCAIFSFHGQKSLTTLGEGGCLVVKSDALARKVPGLRHHGARPFPYKREQYWIPAMGDVDVDLDGVWPINSCLGEPQCALGSAVLKRLDSMNNKRIDRAHRFKEELKDFPELTFQTVKNGFKHVYHLLTAKYEGTNGKTNDDLIKILFYEHNIKVIVQYYPLYRYPLFQKMGFGMANCPNTDNYYDNMVSFPFHLWMSDEEFDYMISCTKKALKKLKEE
ncbi:MAG: DegT/DnrJ/EryC1/StrS family aminotransferase [Prevotella sp.]|jgi:dTDP-4-amino-4,6-dideoxygalactose transaminase|nr:DegT/DnrJ/EryC1/StrS family aminotransferase [Prevotella sp.]